MFIDSAKIFVKAGDGGNGAISFHRERYVPDGGPDGGDGGSGGNIVFVVNKNLMTLMDYRYKTRILAQPGQNGRGAKMTGRAGDDLMLEVPPGTIVKDSDTGEILADMVFDGQQTVIAHGGRGGKGNARFTTSTRRAPRFAHSGEKGEERKITLELKLIADVGIIGYPNVGKSTILSILTSAHPKIANYPFTTLTPNLGVAHWHDNTFVLADIPGLIEGAHSGAGLGHDFLRHIERTRILVHVIDASGVEGRDPVRDFYTINFELSSFNQNLAKLPQIIAANKSDLPGSDINIERLKKELEPLGIKVIELSAVTNFGVSELLYEISVIFQNLPPIEKIEHNEVNYNVPLRFQTDNFKVKKQGKIYYVDGNTVDKIMRSVNLNDYESLSYFQKMCKQKGIIDELKKQGIEQGDIVNFGGIEFEYTE